VAVLLKVGPIAVICLTLFCVAQNIIGLLNPFELLLSLGVTGVHIRMIFPRQLAVGLLDFVFIRLAADAKRLIQVFSHLLNW
jgi:hypothetical protein